LVLNSTLLNTTSTCPRLAAEFSAETGDQEGSLRERHHD